MQAVQRAKTMTVGSEVTKEQNPFTKQLHYRAKAHNTYGFEWQGDGIDGNRQQPYLSALLSMRSKAIILITY